MEVLELFLRKFAVIHHIVAIHIQTFLQNSCDSKWINISTCNRKSLARTAEPPRVLALVRVDSPSLYCSSWHWSLMVLPSTRMVPSDIHISWTWRQVDTVNENARKTWWSDCLKNWKWRLEQTLTLTSCFFFVVPCHLDHRRRLLGMIRSPFTSDRCQAKQKENETNLKTHKLFDKKNQTCGGGGGGSAGSGGAIERSLPCTCRTWVSFSICSDTGTKHALAVLDFYPH